MWELVSDEEEGLFILTEAHFTDLTVWNDRAPWTIASRDEITDEMRVDAYEGLLFAIGGTYEIVSEDGSEYELRFHPIVSKYPQEIPAFSHHLTLDGDMMSGEVRGRTETWRRVASA